jgi:hypothetical protein
MEAIILLARARRAGLELTPRGEHLVVRGPAAAEDLVKEIGDHKVAVMNLLLDRYPVTLIWPASAKGVAAQPGTWQRLPSGEIEAAYETWEQLQIAALLVFRAQRRTLEDRIERGRGLLAAAAGSPEAERLERHMDKLKEELSDIVTTIEWFS